MSADPAIIDANINRIQLIDKATKVDLWKDRVLEGSSLYVNNVTQIDIFQYQAGKSPFVGYDLKVRIAWDRVGKLLNWTISDMGDNGVKVMIDGVFNCETETIDPNKVTYNDKPALMYKGKGAFFLVNPLSKKQQVLILLNQLSMSVGANADVVEIINKIRILVSEI